MAKINTKSETGTLPQSKPATDIENHSKVQHSTGLNRIEAALAAGERLIRNDTSRAHQTGQDDKQGPSSILTAIGSV